MEILYLDAFFFLNLLADYLLCLSAARLCCLRLRRGRYLLAALLGAVYAAAALLPGLGFLASPWGKLAAGLAMGAAAFAGEARLLRCLLALWTVSAAFGGLLYALSLGRSGPPGLSLRQLLSAFFLCYGLLKLLGSFRSRWDGKEKAEIRLSLGGKEVSFPALVDSGNSVRDPDTGAAVLVASPRALRPLFGAMGELLETLEPVELLEIFARLPGCSGRLRLIPYRSLGGSGLLPVFRPDRLWVDGEESRDLLVAISSEARGDGFEAIL